MTKLLKYVLFDLVRSRIVLLYTLLLLVVSLSFFGLEDNAAKAFMSLLNVLLILLPLVSVVYSTIYIYNSGEFMELLLAQPVRRSQLLMSLYLGLSLSLMLAFLAGVGVPLIFFDCSITALIFILSGVLLTSIFVALALAAAVFTRDKARGIGVAIMLWLFFSLLYDAFVLLLMFQLSDYPLEGASVVFSLLNPVDLARILIMLRIDEAALMGYTGAVFGDFFGHIIGQLAAMTAMLIWIALPLQMALRRFRRKDL